MLCYMTSDLKVAKLSGGCSLILEDGQIFSISLGFPLTVLDSTQCSGFGHTVVSRA